MHARGDRKGSTRAGPVAAVCQDLGFGMAQARSTATRDAARRLHLERHCIRSTTRLPRLTDFVARFSQGFHAHICPCTLVSSLLYAPCVSSRELRVELPCNAPHPRRCCCDQAGSRVHAQEPKSASIIGRTSAHHKLAEWHDGHWPGTGWALVGPT